MRKISKQSILDFPRKDLCHEIWSDPEDGPPVLRPQLRELILSLAKRYLSRFSLPLNACHLYGGSASYQYTEKSDIDVSVFTDWGKRSNKEILNIQDFFKNQVI
jgi:hypothetical protein